MSSKSEESWTERIDRKLYNLAVRNYKYSGFIDRIRWFWEFLVGI